MGFDRVKVPDWHRIAWFLHVSKYCQFSTSQPSDNLQAMHAAMWPDFPDISAMTSPLKFAGLGAALVALVMICWPSSQTQPNALSKLDEKSGPFEYLHQMRSAPGEAMDLKEFRRVMDLALEGQVPTRSLDVPWQQEGPYNIGGRLNCIAVHPIDSDTWFTGSAAGGIYRTSDAGESWSSTGDDFAYLSIGDITFAPSNPSVMYVGTGDPNISGSPHPGNGVYKSTDGGASWTHVGLSDACIISQVVVHPTNSEIVYASAMGIPFVPTPDRGVYRSMNGGDSWELVHFVNDQTGAIDLIMHPDEPNRLFCATWTRVRNNQESIISGEDCRIWRSTDAGDNWEMMTNGLPTGELSRIGLTSDVNDPDRVFALVIDTTFQIEGLYRTIDGGDSWGNVNWDIDQMSNAMGGFGWYFGKLFVSPQSGSQISILGVDMWTTDNSGTSWYMSVPPWWEYSVHADKHDLAFLPDGSVLVATDGGLYRNTSGISAATAEFGWEDVDNIPNSQFYHVAINPFEPDRYTGGAQDNGTTTGNMELGSEWTRDLGGDGFQAYFDDEIVGLRYAAIQYGELRFQEDDAWGWSDFINGIDPDDRRNWDMPYIPSAHSNEVFYTGTYRMYRNDAAPYGNWEATSGDLTDGVIFGNNFHTISCIGESPVQDGLLYAGTTDANVWVSSDWGENWTEVTAGLPERYVTDLKASPLVANTVYATHSGYKDNDNVSYIHKSLDMGATWTSIAGDLPDLPINEVEIINDSTFVVATDVGVYFSNNEGENWERVGNNMPLIPVFDLALHPENGELVAATFARSMMTFPLDSLVPPVVVVDNVGERVAPVLRAWPNPANDQLFVDGLGVNTSALLFDASGKRLAELQLVSGQAVPVHDLSAGLYTLVVGQGADAQTLSFLVAR